MSKQLEERVAILEAEVASLKNKLEVVSSAKTPWWNKIGGNFADNSAYDEAMQLGREYRESILLNSIESQEKMRQAEVGAAAIDPESMQLNSIQSQDI